MLSALKDLEAELIYVPPLELKYLEKGHACHFRCNRKDIKGLRIDIISKLRGCDTFDKLWERRKTILLNGKNSIDVIGIKDLVQSKKTQRDKDWFMLKRLVNNDIILHKYKAAKERILWWLGECRDVGVLIELVKRYPKIAKEYVLHRPLLKSAIAFQVERLNEELRKEEECERQKDKTYWAPLRQELEELRHRRLRFVR
ncbi:MAG: hypothetical protein NC935_01185 [Candidatus Omnitrophica bacterium]|nr:hypothetical protein [Candidatus Omnitrophota bacterium]